MLKICDVSYSYNQKKAITDISFSMKRGEVVSILGSNGSGKTTILKCINGILRPNSGKVFLDQFRLDKMNRNGVARLISSVPQEHNATFSYLAIDVVLMGVTPYLKFGRMPGNGDYSEAEKIMKKMNISHLSYRNYNRLSGGEKQLVLIARSLMQQTEFLLMDEPTSHLDFKNQHLLMEEVRKRSQEGKGILIALHDPNLALKFCDGAIIVKEGKILIKGKTEEILTGGNLQEAYGIGVRIQELSKGNRLAFVEG